jgi:hypothetical protein
MNAEAAKSTLPPPLVSEAARRQGQSEAVRRYLAEFPDDISEADLAAVEAEWQVEGAQ